MIFCIWEGIMPMKRAVLAGLGVVALSGFAHGDIQSVDFNTPGDLINNFSLNNQTGAGGFNQAAHGGISDSGAVDVTAGPSAIQDMTAVYRVKGYNWDAGRSIRVSQFVKILPQYTTGDVLLQLGMIDDPAARHQFNRGVPYIGNFISAQVFPTAAPGASTGAFAWQAVSGNLIGTNTETATWFPSAPFNLILGDWYRFDVDITKTSVFERFGVTGFMQDMGTDGLTPGATISFPTTNPDLYTNNIYNDTTVYAAFRGQASTGGADLYDNFFVLQPIPEPASPGLAGLGAMALAARRKRK